METILDINGNWKQVDNSTPEWKKYYADLKVWQASKNNYILNKIEWYMSKPNKPGYYRSNND